ncbi:hypothetical protein LSUE1_G002017, partial [Lachnellula suecica]
TMITLLADGFEDLVVSKTDLAIASIAWGFSLGFGILTTWKAIKQTVDMQRRYGLSKLNSPYIWMIWLEILVCLIFSVICWLHLWGVIPSRSGPIQLSFPLQADRAQFCLLLHHFNDVGSASPVLAANHHQSDFASSHRIRYRFCGFLENLVLTSSFFADRRKAMRMKIGVAIFITAINISVYCIWIPARLQISERYEFINVIWDRCEKVIYLVVDAVLNWYFIHIIRKKLVRHGLVKYDRVVRFNMYIIGFSLGMDILIIGMMSLNNSFVYMQFHPLAYIVKLNIEMTMADLIAKVCRSNHNLSDIPAILSNESGKSSQLNSMSSISRWHSAKSQQKLVQEEHWADMPSSEVELYDIPRKPYAGEIAVNMKREVHVTIERRTSVNTVDEKRGGENRRTGTGRVEDDMKPLPLKAENQERDEREIERAKRTGVERGMGVHTKVWGPEITRVLSPRPSFASLR